MVGINLKNLRLNSGLKANKIAEMLGISRKQLNNIENAKMKNIDKHKEKLSRIYKVSQRSVEKAWGETKNGKTN